MVADKIALMIRAVASFPRPERQRLIAALAEPGMLVALDAPPISAAADSVRDENLDWLRELIQMKLDEAAPPMVVSARQLPVSADSSEPASPERLVEVALPDAQRMSIKLPAFHPVARFGMLLLLGMILFAAVIVAFWTARRLAGPHRRVRLP